MSLFVFLWHFVELLVAIYLAAGTRTSPAWGIGFLAASKIILKHKTFPFLFLLGLNISIAYFQKRRKNVSIETFGEISKSPLACFPKETFSYFRRYTDTVVYFFTRASGRSDDEFSDDDDVSRKEGLSQQSGECEDDNAAEKQDAAKQETKATACQFFPPKSARKRKGDADGEIGIKRSKFEEEDLPVERGIDCSQAVEVPSPPSSADSTDRPQALLSDSLSQDSGAANSDGTGGTSMEQVVTKPDPDESTSSESMLLSPPAEKTRPSVKISNSEESFRSEPMNADAESKALLPEIKDRDSRENSCTCKSSFQGNVGNGPNWQRVKEVLPAESPDSVESRDCKDDNMRQIPSPRGGVPRERRHDLMDGKITNKDLPDVVTSSTEGRVREEIALATKEFFEKRHERSKPKHPRMSDRKRMDGNVGGGAIRIEYEDIIKHPLFRSWPRVDRPGPSSDLGCITIYYHKDSGGKTLYYREYPGLSLQPLTVKKDANYQKRFYRHQRSMIMPIKMGEMIQWCINFCQDFIDGIPKYQTSDEDKLSLGEYHELSHQLMQAIVRTYKSIQEGEWKTRKAKKNSTGRKKTGYAASSFQDESPSDSSSDETLYMHPLSKTSPEEDLSKRCVAPISPSESARQPLNLQLPDFSFDCNVSRVQPQSEFFDAIAPKLSVSHHQYFHRNPEPRAYRYGSYSNPRASLQPVQIKFVPETFRNSTRLIYCRDNMSFDSGVNSRIRLKPFFEVEKVLRLEGQWPSVSVEEFLQALLTFQELYYQMLYDESERFYTFREDIYRCVIPMRNIESAEGELDEDNPKPKSSDSGQSSKSVSVSYGEVSSSTSETNIPGGATSENVEVAIGSAVDTSACSKRKHVVWYPPTAKETHKDTGLDSPPGSSDTESASE